MLLPSNSHWNNQTFLHFLNSSFCLIYETFSSRWSKKCPHKVKNNRNCLTLTFAPNNCQYFINLYSGKPEIFNKTCLYNITNQLLCFYDLIHTEMINLFTVCKASTLHKTKQFTSFTFISYITFWVVVWVALSPYRKKVTGSSLGLVSWHFGVEFACPPRVCVGFLRVLRFPT